MSGETIIEPSRSTPVYGEFDVVVVGGGPAGIMAASASARAGRSTLLIERYGFLGGAGTAGGLSTFCGLHARTHSEDVRVIRGLADELVDAIGDGVLLHPAQLTVAPRHRSTASQSLASIICLNHRRLGEASVWD